jgi:hypothetical protein
VAVAAFLAAAGIAAGAIYDHTHPRPTPEREWVSEWYCTHYGRRCGDTKPWHQGWHEREPYYDYGFASTLTVAALFGLASVSRLQSKA